MALSAILMVDHSGSQYGRVHDNKRSPHIAHDEHVLALSSSFSLDFYKCQTVLLERSAFERFHYYDIVYANLRLPEVVYATGSLLDEQRKENLYSKASHLNRSVERKNALFSNKHEAIVLYTNTKRHSNMFIAVYTCEPIIQCKYFQRDTFRSKRSEQTSSINVLPTVIGIDNTMYCQLYVFVLTMAKIARINLNSLPIVIR